MKIDVFLTRRLDLVETMLRRRNLWAFRAATIFIQISYNPQRHLNHQSLTFYLPMLFLRAMVLIKIWRIHVSYRIQVSRWTKISAAKNEFCKDKIWREEIMRRKVSEEWFSTYVCIFFRFLTTKRNIIFFFSEWSPPETKFTGSARAPNQVYVFLYIFIPPMRGPEKNLTAWAPGTCKKHPTRKGFAWVGSLVVFSWVAVWSGSQQVLLLDGPWVGPVPIWFSATTQKWGHSS